MSTNVNLQSILNSNILIKANFLDWLRNLIIILKAKRIVYVLDGPLPLSPTVDAFNEDQMAYQKHLGDSELVGCIMLASMSPKL